MQPKQNDERAGFPESGCEERRTKGRPSREAWSRTTFLVIKEWVKTVSSSIFKLRSSWTTRHLRCVANVARSQALKEAGTELSPLLTQTTWVSVAWLGASSLIPKSKINVLFYQSFHRDLSFAPQFMAVNTIQHDSIYFRSDYNFWASERDSFMVTGKYKGQTIHIRWWSYWLPFGLKRALSQP